MAYVSPTAGQRRVSIASSCYSKPEYPLSACTSACVVVGLYFDMYTLDASILRLLSV